MLKDAGEVNLWVRPEVLELAILPVLPTDKISVEVSLQLLLFCL